ncbi:DUF4160 domain-containing protein [Candidatus Ozemobacteraceae bacterium]|nr:DUF4160 domain-containing protein [Candidatus Ozemobacteraceae bacterium]
MPVIKRFANCTLRLNLRDHHPPHFHLLLRDGRMASVDLGTFEIIGDVERREVLEAMNWAQENRETLLKVFEELKT